jgi:hypothetical protein
MKSLFPVTLLILSSVFAPIPLHASVVSLSSQKSSFTANEEFLVDTSIDTQGYSMNAIEGAISYPEDLLDLVDVRTGDSIVSLWLEQLQPSQKSPASFSGIIPGGYLSPKGKLVTLVFRTKASGQGSVTVNNLHVVQNTEEGTPLPASSVPFTFTVSASHEKVEEAPIADRNPPENFPVQITRDETLYNGQAFAVFAAQDKGSGIASYELREGLWGTWQQAESPHQLSDQSLTKKIYVKAIDKNGNARISVGYPEHYTPWYANDAILILVLLCIGGFVWFTHAKLK